MGNRILKSPHREVGEGVFPKLPMLMAKHNDGTPSHLLYRHLHRASPSLELVRRHSNLHPCSKVKGSHIVDHTHTVAPSIALCRERSIVTGVISLWSRASHPSLLHHHCLKQKGDGHLPITYVKVKRTHLSGSSSVKIKNGVSTNVLSKSNHTRRGYKQNIMHKINQG